MAQIREELLNKNLMLEDGKRKNNDLKMQLISANQVIEWVEKEKAQYMNEKVQLQINYDTALKERESLLHQTHKAQKENISLKLEIQKLEETISSNEAENKAIGISLKEVQERFLKVKSSVERLLCIYNLQYNFFQNI